MLETAAGTVWLVRLQFLDLGLMRLLLMVVAEAGVAAAVALVVVLMPCSLCQPSASLPWLHLDPWLREALRVQEG